MISSEAYLEQFVPDFLKDVKPYVPSHPDQVLINRFGCPFLHRLNNNENPFGPPPAAVEILEKFDFTKSSVYPQGDSYFLRKALAEHYRMDSNCFICADGSNGLIAAVVKAFCEKGDNIITADRTYAVYEWAASYIGCESKLIPLDNYGFDYDKMLSAIDNRTKVVFLCNPNNPTGTYWPPQKVKDFIEAINRRTIIVIDEAYLEYVSGDFEQLSAVNLLAEHPNLMVMKTFSKIYGLAGLRIGYLIGGAEITRIVNRTIICYAVNSVAMLAAEAIVRDVDGTLEHCDKTRDAARTSASLMRACSERLNLECRADGYGFTMIKLPFSDTRAYRMLMAKGYMVRTMTGFRFPDWIRVSSSTPEVIQGFCNALQNILT